jgi:hypothetical protein
MPADSKSTRVYSCLFLSKKDETHPTTIKWFVHYVYNSTTCPRRGIFNSDSSKSTETVHEKKKSASRLICPNRQAEIPRYSRRRRLNNNNSCAWSSASRKWTHSVRRELPESEDFFGHFLFHFEKGNCISFSNNSFHLPFSFFCRNAFV